MSRIDCNAGMQDRKDKRKNILTWLSLTWKNYIDHVMPDKFAQNYIDNWEYEGNVRES